MDHVVSKLLKSLRKEACQSDSALSCSPARCQAYSKHVTNTELNYVLISLLKREKEWERGFGDRQQLP